MKKAWKILNKSENEVELFIYGDITDTEWDETDMTAMKLNNQLNELGDIDTLNLRISSGGGNVYQGLAIYNSLFSYKQANKVKIKATIDSIAASISSVIPLVADEVIAYESSDYMIHLPSTFTVGNQDDHRDTADFLDRMTEKIVNIYHNKTGIDKETLKDMMRSETWLNGLEAKEKGFIDTIITADNNNNQTFNNSIDKDSLKMYKNVPDRVFNKLNINNKVNSKNKGGKKMFKQFETEAAYKAEIENIKKDFKNQLKGDTEFLNSLDGYTKVTDVMNTLNEVVKGETLEEVVNNIKAVKNEYNELNNKNTINERKVALNEAGLTIEDLDVENESELLDIADFERIVNLVKKAKDSVADNSNGGGFDPNAHLGGEDTSNLSATDIFN